MVRSFDTLHHALRVFGATIKLKHMQDDAVNDVLLDAVLDVWDVRALKLTPHDSAKLVACTFRRDEEVRHLLAAGKFRSSSPTVSC